MPAEALGERRVRAADPTMETCVLQTRGSTANSREMVFLAAVVLGSKDAGFMENQAELVPAGCLQGVIIIMRS